MRRSDVASWVRQYGAATFRAPDALVGYLVCACTALIAYYSSSARGQAAAVLTATAAIDAGLLGIVLAAMAIVTAFVDRTFVAFASRGLQEELMPFATVSVVAALGVGVGVLGLFGVGALATGWTIALLALSAGLTAWAVAGVVQLVALVIYFASVRARQIAAIEEANQVRTRRLSS